VKKGYEDHFGGGGLFAHRFSSSPAASDIGGGPNCVEGGLKWGDEVYSRERE